MLAKLENYEQNLNQNIGNSGPCGHGRRILLASFWGL